MGTKPWYQSKTIWAWVVAGLLGIYNANPFGWPVVPDWVYALLASFGVYSRTATTTKIG